MTSKTPLTSPLRPSRHFGGKVVRTAGNDLVQDLPVSAIVQNPEPRLPKRLPAVRHSSEGPQAHPAAHPITHLLCVHNWSSCAVCHPAHNLAKGSRSGTQ